MSAIFFDPANVKPHLGHWLTWAEFKVVWIYQWVAWFFGRLGYEELSEDERAQFAEVTNAMDWAIRELATKGMEFEGLYVAPNGQVVLSQGGPVELRNELFLNRIRRGKWLDPEHNIEFAMKFFEDHGISYDKEVFRMALDQCQRDRAEFAKQIEPEERAMYTESLDYLMRHLGLVKATEAN